ncbi:MAG TPA: sigma-70 family RNA polymerase sigma factor [Candidatus Saccharimonadales bacterium]|nr:sigma-70 family RNA polymerase sigma factor [Candidatus Saccharimonadales bacterium]
MLNDLNLLRQYAETGAEEPFQTIVERHARMVYATALRMSRDHSLAEDVKQAVFILLVRKARSLSTNTILAGWLYRTARFVALEALRNRKRQLDYDSRAAEMNESSGPEPDQVTPFLEEAMALLAERDRDAIVLRFLEEKTFAEVAQALGITEPAAKMRVGRALDKLRSAFGRIGIPVSLAVLMTGLSTCGASAVPVGIAATSVAANPLGTTSELVTQSIKTMTWNKIKTFGAGALAACLLGGVSFVLHHHFLAIHHRPAMAGKAATFEPMSGSWQGSITIHAGPGSPVMSQGCSLLVQTSDKGRVCEIEMRVEGKDGAAPQIHHYSHTLGKRGDQIYTVSDPRSGRGDGNGAITEKFYAPEAGEWHMAMNFPFPENRGVMEGRWERHQDDLFIRSHDEFFTPAGSNHLYADLRLHRVTLAARQ